MHYHADRVFPDAAPVIEALVTEKKEFASLLADYEELSTWLAVRERSATTDDEEIENVRELIRELENEIRQQLEEYDEHTR